VKLLLGSEQKPICEKIKMATSLKSRLVGLIGTRQLNDEGLFIPRCNWIHTFFMSMPIDVVYLDKKGVVRKMDLNLQPWKLPAPVWSAQNVLELPAGFIEQKSIKVGDTLHVGH
jgi:uncharacterized membrane protein (UPF0127 family)